MKRLLPLAAFLLVSIAWLLTRPPSTSLASTERQDLSAEQALDPQQPRAVPIRLALQSPTESPQGTREPAPGQVAHEADEPLLFGTVMSDALPPEPVSGARLILDLERAFTPQEQLAETRSAKDGSYRFSLDVLPEMAPLTRAITSLSLSVRAADFQPTNKTLTLEERDASSGRLDFRLTTGPAIRGRVLEPSGKPAVRGTVTLQLVLGEHASTMSFAQTDEQGIFVLALKRGAPGMLIARKEDFSPASLDLTEWDLELHPDVGDLRLGGASSIAGRVMCADGTPIPGARVLISDSAPLIKTKTFFFGAEARGVTDRQGDFELRGLTGDEFEIELAGHTFGPFPAGSRGVELTYPGRALRVRVRDEEDRPLGNMDLEVVEGLLEDGTFQPWFSTTIETHATSGDAVFPLDESNAVVLHAEISETYNIQQLFSLDPGPCLVELEWTLLSPPPTGQLEVTLRDPTGEPLTNYNLELMSPIDDMFLYDVYPPGPHTVLAGRYWAKLSSPDRRGEYDLPLLLAPFELPEGSRIHIDQQLSLGGRLAIQALASEDPETLTSYILGHYTGADRVRHQMQYHSKPGAPRLFISNEVLPPGAYLFEAKHEGYEPISESLQAIAGKITQLQQPLQAALE